MAETRSHNDHLTVTLDNGTALLNYVPPYIVTEKKKIYNQKRPHQVQSDEKKNNLTMK